jgi:hypothetical protein
MIQEPKALDVSTRASIGTRHRSPMLVCGLAMLWIVCAAGMPRADELPAKTTQLSDSAFAMLNSVTADPEKDNPMLAPVASLAGDAQTLASAVQGGDLTAASHAMAAIGADQKLIDEVAAKNSGKLNASQWNGIKGEIAALEKDIPPVAGPTGPSVPAAATGPAPAAAEDSPAAQSDAPKVAIFSRVFSDSSVHLRGFLEGTDLKSAGIFDGDQLRKAIAIGTESGSQRVNFDFTIEEPPPGESIRVFDNLGRSAQAMVVTDAPVSVSSSGHGRDKMIELGGGMTDDSVASAEPAPAPPPEPDTHNNTAEIPTESPDGSVAPPRRLPGGVGPLANVQINILGVLPIQSAPGNYEVVGQIAGAGVKRAGVYLGGRLVRKIPITAGAFSSFDVKFPMMNGGAATIRAYGMGSDFVEASIDTSDFGMSDNTMTNSGVTEFDSSTTTTTNYPPAYPVAPYYGASPYRPNPYAYGYPNPYAPNPYPATVTPYGAVVTPYGAPVNPYAPQPYPYGYSPYAAPAPAPATSWWKKVF